MAPPSPMLPLGVTPRPPIRPAHRSLNTEMEAIYFSPYRCPSLFKVYFLGKHISIFVLAGIYAAVHYDGYKYGFIMVQMIILRYIMM